MERVLRFAMQTAVECIVTSLPLEKARSSIGADNISRAKRPLLYLSSHRCHPLLAFNQVRSTVNPKGYRCHPHWCTTPAWNVSPPPTDSDPPSRCTAMVAAKYLGLWGQISRFLCWRWQKNGGTEDASPWTPSRTHWAWWVGPWWQVSEQQLEAREQLSQ